MTLLGKSLVFQFKYQPEMNRLYWKKSKSDEVNDPEILRMVHRVGDQCREEVSEFLMHCGARLSEQFDKVAKASMPQVDDKKWTVSCGVWPKHKNKPPNQNWKMKAGVAIPRTKAEAIAWLWSVGEQQGKEKLIQHFAPHATDVADLHSEWVAIARIPLFPTNLDGFDVDREPLLDQVQQAFSQITQSQFESAYDWILARKF